jgi:group I intron endonuclease
MVMKKNFYLKKTCGIYCITHTPTGRKYVGQSVDCFERWKQHSTPKKASAGIKGAIMAYGVGEFSFVIIQECKREELNEREVYWIAELRTLSPAGFNLTSGGGAGTSVSDATRASISATKTGKKIPAISIAKKGKSVAPLTPAHRANMSASQKGRTQSSAHTAAIVEGKRRNKAARAEAEAFAAPLQKLTDTLRYDRSYVTIAEDGTAAAGSPPPSLEELEELLQML